MTLFKHIPKIAREVVEEQLNILEQKAKDGQIQLWLDEMLTNLQNDNPVLYRYITERSKKLAVGALMINDPDSLAVTFALEYLLLLTVLGQGYAKQLKLQNFIEMMNSWFNRDELDGLDEL